MAANPKHERKEECEGVLGYLTSLKFLKMLMFMLDMHSICQFISKQFQREHVLIIEVAPLLQKAFLALENLRGGKGERMLQFASAFQETGKYKDTVLNRGRHETRRLHQARMERFAVQNMEDETAATTALFNSFNFYADFLIATLKERFAPITQEPIAYFSIF